MDEDCEHSKIKQIEQMEMFLRSICKLKEKHQNQNR